MDLERRGVLKQGESVFVWGDTKIKIPPMVIKGWEKGWRFSKNSSRNPICPELGAYILARVKEVFM